MIGKAVLGLWIALHLSSLFVNNAGVLGVVRVVDESADEQHDAEIFRAIVESMSEWETKKHRRGHRAKREVSKVCYEDVGCFEDTGPFSYLEMLPSPPKDVGTRFFVFGSRKARSVPMEVPADRISEKANSAIDPALPTKVIVHGFGSSCDHVWVYEMRMALMAVIECNIVCVDWGPGSAVPNYVRAAANTRLVGRQLAKLVRSLNVPLDKIHLIGFSLGAHVAGFAGAELGNVSRITGLDPAGPLFEAQDPRARLDESDAQFVDVIHSNGEQLILGGLGSWQPMGDVDFYPNGGKMQSGCSNLFLGAVSDIIWASSVEGRSLCNHRRAYKLFTDSISPKCRFPAFACQGGYEALLRGECFPCGPHPGGTPCADMGFYSDRSEARGQMYLVTRDEEPFCAHQYQIRVYNSKHERPVKSYGKLQIKVIADGFVNETFTMTKKDDEELLVGALLQKIIVPHPMMTNLEGVEIKYTAYSGWISSGLVSWAIDKVAILDSYGTTWSFCKRGVVLESGRWIFLPLFQNECDVPPELDNTTLPAEEDSEPPPPAVVMAEEGRSQQQGIGPFTKDQNYERKDSLSNEVPQKSLGPFTKDQNIKIANEQAKVSTPKDYADGGNNEKNYQSASSLWSIAELAHDDGSSNSLENSNKIGEPLERGRGFGVPQQPPSLTLERVVTLTTLTERPADETPRPSEVHEPVLRPGAKKETGRSLRLAEITEPVLRPRGTRQDGTGVSEQRMDDRKSGSEMLDESSSSRGFTVQFLPERLAGILAQAERYARMTLLPLISQYTPSFIQGGRQDRPKYFPPLGNLFSDKNEDKPNSEPADSRTKYYYEFDEKESTTTTTTTTTTTASSTVRNNSKGLVEMSTTTVVSALPTTEKKKEDQEVDQWVPMSVKPLQPTQSSLGSDRKDKSFGGVWVNEGDGNWSTTRANDTDSVVTETKIDDWVPIVSNLTTSTNSTKATTEDRKFIPLTDFATESNAPRSSDLPPEDKKPQARSIVFPYVYERKNDPRTRYIPLLPEEDVLGGLVGAKEHSKR